MLPLIVKSNKLILCKKLNKKSSKNVRKKYLEVVLCPATLSGSRLICTIINSLIYRNSTKYKVHTYGLNVIYYHLFISTEKFDNIEDALLCFDIDLLLVFISFRFSSQKSSKTILEKHKKYYMEVVVYESYLSTHVQVALSRSNLNGIELIRSKDLLPIP